MLGSFDYRRQVGERARIAIKHNYLMLRVPRMKQQIDEIS